MDESPKKYAEGKKPDPREYILYKSIYVKLPDRRNRPVVKEIRAAFVSGDHV